MPASPDPRNAALVAGAMLALSACTSLQPPAGAPDERAVHSGTCHADPVQWASGEEAMQEITDRVWRESHSSLIRPIAPDQAITRGFRAGRINIEIDAGSRITRICCGGPCGAIPGRWWHVPRWRVPDIRPSHGPSGRPGEISG